MTVRTCAPDNTRRPTPEKSRMDVMVRFRVLSFAAATCSVIASACSYEFVVDLSPPSGAQPSIDPSVGGDKNNEVAEHPPVFAM